MSLPLTLTPLYPSHPLSPSLPPTHRKARMRELERKALVLAKKTDSDMAKMGRDDALRDLAAEKVSTYVHTIIFCLILCLCLFHFFLSSVFVHVF